MNTKLAGHLKLTICSFKCKKRPVRRKHAHYADKPPPVLEGEGSVSTGKRRQSIRKLCKILTRCNMAWCSPWGFGHHWDLGSLFLLAVVLGRRRLIVLNHHIHCWYGEHGVCIQLRQEPPVGVLDRVITTRDWVRLFLMQDWTNPTPKFLLNLHVLHMKVGEVR